jgi:hypothetical protein
MKEVDKKSAGITGKKKLYFRILSFVFSLLLLVVLELILRLFSVGDNLNLFMTKKDKVNALKCLNEMKTIAPNYPKIKLLESMIN